MENRQANASRVDPELTAALKEARALEKTFETSPGGVGRGLKLETLDHVRQALWQAEKALQKRVAAGTAKQGEVTDLGDLRRSFTKELDRLDVTAKAGPKSLKAEGGKYAQGRKVYGETSKSLEAMELGRNWLKGDIEVLQKEIAKLSAKDRDFLLVGVARDIEERLYTNPGAAAKLLGKTVAKNRLRAMFTNKKDYNEFRQLVLREDIMAGVERKVVGGSPTGLRKAAAADVGGQLGGAEGAAVALATGQPLAGHPSMIFRNILSESSAAPDRVLKELAIMLTSKDPVVKAEAIKQIELVSKNLTNRSRAIESIGSVFSRMPSQLAHPLWLDEELPEEHRIRRGGLPKAPIFPTLKPPVR
jgi:hypothetical protein